MMSDHVHAQEFDNVPCPFCGLLCDDLRVAVTRGVATVSAHGCARSRAMFSANANDTATALVDGKPADLATAGRPAPGSPRAAGPPPPIFAGAERAGLRVLTGMARRRG